MEDHERPVGDRQNASELEIPLVGVGPQTVFHGDDLRPGLICPQCKEGVLDYDGLLNLTCPRCGFGLGGCFT